MRFEKHLYCAIFNSASANVTSPIQSEERYFTYIGLIKILILF